ncbi:Crp/Fnr family transcriptional regulator [Lacinutrix neustonica]|uniref:Crp/Fnr family transcriptional regulator n=1 Tax=Lacinutrix neustonica TaxID=2980107 RepID=UPI0028BE194E|nr:Crp/Fnr family transcriptional regulator [Lacinutrix neustonica]
MKKSETIKKFREDFMLIDIGQTIKFMPLLLSGAIKILREDEQGDELILYFIEQGDTCAMTITCCVGNTKSEIRAVAETETKLIMIPVEKMSEWMSKYKSWQNFILQSYHERLMEMLETIDNIAFLKMDERLLKYLRDKAKVNHNERIQTTHKEIANDLHTSRVVISRLLKALEKDSKIELQRNCIKIIDL